MQNPIYVVDCKRTAIGRTNKGLKAFPSAHLAAVVMDALLERNSVDGVLISEVILGNAVSAGTGQNLARKAVALSKLPITVPAYVVNNVCGSGLQALILGAQKILAGDGGIVIAGAAESATHNPQLVSGADKELVDSLIHDGLFCSLAEKHMGVICDALAQKSGISRRQQDEYTLEDHRRACAAREGGKFKQETVAVTNAKGDVFDKDERPREKTSLEKLGSLPPAFSADGTVTAGNASAPSDGACGFLLASEEEVKKNAWIPLAKILGYSSVAVEPAEVFSKGTRAIEKCLDTCRLTMDDIDLFEITEAFAAQAIDVQQALKIPKGKMNIWGGDVALGHPLGIAGSRALVTLIHALRDQQKKLGLVYVSFGAGGAIAVAVEVTS